MRARGPERAGRQAGDWLGPAAHELAHLGFVLRDGSLPGTVPGPRLLVALRPTPTLRHFDPEEATFWAFDGARGTLATIRRGDVGSGPALPAERPFSWGRIRIADRVPVSNQFLSFGGTLRAARTPDDTLVLAFTSPAPILRWSGHSQLVDRFADELGSFFGRLMVPVDFQDGAEARIGEASPEGLYAAAVRLADRRLERDRVARASTTSRWTRRSNTAVHRLRRDAPEAWSEGEALLDLARPAVAGPTRPVVEGSRESRRPRADPGPSSVWRGTRYLSSAFSVRNALATSASAFWSTATLTPSSVSSSVVSSAETSSRSAWKAFASPTLAR